MNRHRSLASLLLLGIACTGCSEPKKSANKPEPEGNPSGNGGSGPVVVSPADPVEPGGGGADPVGSGGAAEPAEPVDPGPQEPFVLENGLCQPNLTAEPDPIHESGHFNATISSVTGTSDVVFFAESATFNEIPPRIARVTSSGQVETLLDGEFSNLRVFGDTLYFAGSNELLSLDLATPGAEPVVVMAVTRLLDYDERNVLFSDEDGAVWIAALGVALAPAAEEGAGEVAASGDAGLSADAGVEPSATTAPDAGMENPEPAGATLLLTARPFDVSLFGDTVYYTDGDTVLRIGVNGGEPTPLFPPDSFNFITSVGTDGTGVFFDNDDVLTTVSAEGGATLVLGRAGPDSLFGDTAAFSQFLPGRGVVYWVDDGSSFGWTALDGQSCGVLGRFSSFFDAQGHLTDGEFFVGGDSGLYRVARVD